MRTGGSSLGLSNGSLQLNFIDKSRGNRYGSHGTTLYLSSPIIVIIIMMMIIIIKIAKIIDIDIAIPGDARVKDKKLEKIEK